MSYKIPIIATIATFDAPADVGEDWEDQPTKVEPDTALLEYGFRPNDEIRVEHVNWIFNRFLTETERLAHAQIQNWPDKWSATLAGTNIVGDYARATWDMRQLVLVNNLTTIFESYDEGQTWSVADTLAGAAYRAVASFDGATEANGAVCATCIVAGAGRISMRGQAAGWNDQALTNATEPWAICADPYAGCFWAVGERTGPLPGIWRITPNDGSAPTTIATTSQPTTTTAALRSVCAGPTYKLACANGTQLWRWEDNATAAAAVTKPGAGTLKAVAYSPEDELYYLAQDSGGDLEIWVLPTGATGSWTQVFGSGGNDLEVQIDGIAVVNGSVCFCANDVTLSVPFILATSDRGETWIRIPSPLLASTNVSLSKIRRAGNRLLAADYGSSGLVAVSLSMRASEPL